mmetsp:Transcript_21272/g.24610  ORF Transcript_21272/g.24610 Transcript_21272/m.24610 type:complete len:370 (+) Transcript_21272:920-2029(+)
MIHKLRGKCANEGFDLCDPIHTQWYNDLIEEEGHVAKGTLQKIPSPPSISDVNTDGEDLHYNAVLIGNSKSIWPKFIAWLSSRCEKKLLELANNGTISRSRDEILNQVLNDSPFDTFVTETLSKVFHLCCSAQKGIELASYDFFWSNGVHRKVDLDNRKEGDEELSVHNQNGDADYHCYVSNKERSSFLVSMQRVAKVTGKYWHDDEGTKLCVHPQFGTWKAFRAVVVFHKKIKAEKSAEPPLVEIIPKAPMLCPCPVAAEEIQKAKQVMAYALKMASSDRGGGDEDDEKTENLTYDDSPGKMDLCTYLHNSVTSGSDWSNVSPTMRPWIQLRDCISVGRDEYKYCDNQLLYHYTKDKEILRRELKLLL